MFAEAKIVFHGFLDCPQERLEHMAVQISFSLHNIV